MISIIFLSLFNKKPDLQIDHNQNIYLDLHVILIYFSDYYFSSFTYLNYALSNNYNKLLITRLRFHGKNNSDHHVLCLCFNLSERSNHAISTC